MRVAHTLGRRIGARNGLRLVRWLARGSLKDGAAAGIDL